MNIPQYMQQLGEQARKASRTLNNADTNIKNLALRNIAMQLLEQQATILRENQKDLDAGKNNGLDDALLDRLALNPDRIKAMSDGLLEIVQLADPVGEITDLNYRPSGIQVGKMRVPLGVIGIIYESRPNVTADAAALCLKSGNASILRGGSEAIHSNKAIAQCIQQGLTQAGLPQEVVQFVETTDRQAVSEMITMPQYVDVIVPRGGKGLIARISGEAKVPVIKHLNGICHVYIDDKADVAKAIDIAFNAKTHRYGVCNAMETLLIAKSIAAKVLPELCKRYAGEKVELRVCPETKKLIQQYDANLVDATDEDWDSEYLAPILSIRLVNGVEQAIEHITQHSSGHTEAIVTEDYSTSRQFLAQVDSSSVMVNASTRFADGFEYGLGAEIGISTDKIHVRGPVGLEGLTSQKYIVLGDGHIRG